MKIDIKKVANLANLRINRDEEKELEKQLTDILSYVEVLDGVDTESVEETAQVTGLENVTREDRVAPSLTQEEAVFQTKNKDKGFFRVKAILENE